MVDSPIMRQILRKAIESPIFSKEVLLKAPLTIFEGNEIYKDLANIIKRYYQTHREVLTEEAFLTLVEDKLDRMKKDAETQQLYFNKVSELYTIRNPNDDSIIDEKIEKYIRKHMMMDVLKKAAMNLENEEVMEQISEDIKKVMLLDISGKKQEIINVLDDIEYKKQVLSTLYQNIIPTGIKAIDNLNGGGLAKGELGIVLASSGTGKTLILTNLATNYTRARYNVLFIALEELENRMILRFEQSLLRQNKSNILNGTNLNTAYYDKLQNFIQKNRDAFGNLLFARYSPRTVTPAKIEQLISDAVLRMGINIDVVIVDYPELLRNPHATGNEADDGGKLFEEMRRIGQDYNVVMWTAGQLNRTAYHADIKTSAHTEGSLRKINAAELVLVVNQTPEEFNAGFTRLYVDKLRNPPEGAYDRMIGLRVVGSKMLVRDYKDEEERKQHKYILEAAESAKNVAFNAKKQGKKTKTEQPSYADEINKTIQRLRGDGDED